MSRYSTILRSLRYAVKACVLLMKAAIIGALVSLQMAKKKLTSWVERTRTRLREKTADGEAEDL